LALGAAKAGATGDCDGVLYEGIGGGRWRKSVKTYISQ